VYCGPARWKVLPHLNETMKENVLDVLVYLFENYMTDDIEPPQDQASLQDELSRAGFGQGEINKAFDWLEGLTTLQESDAEKLDSPRTNRIYTDEEAERINVECRGLLMHLEQAGVLDQHSRELVIDRVMALEAEEIDSDVVKWVVLMVLFNQPGQEAAYAWMEDFVFEENYSQLH